MKLQINFFVFCWFPVKWLSGIHRYCLILTSSKCAETFIISLNCIHFAAVTHNLTGSLTLSRSDWTIEQFIYIFKSSEEFSRPFIIVWNLHAFLNRFCVGMQWRCTNKMKGICRLNHKIHKNHFSLSVRHCSMHGKMTVKMENNSVRHGFSVSI